MTACRFKTAGCSNEACRVFGCQLQREAQVKAGWYRLKGIPTNREFFVTWRTESGAAVVRKKEGA